MRERTGSLLYYTISLEEEPFNEYIKANHEKGREINLQSILLAGFVRILALKPALNRFVMSGRIYARNGIQISMQVKRKLEDDSLGSSVKFHFTGKENIFEVHEIISRQISGTKNDVDDSTDSLVKVLTKMPVWLLDIGVRFLWWLDRRGFLPMSIIEASPFHASVYFTNLRSIKVGPLFHHLYDFGTAGVFVSLCRTQVKPVLQKDGTVVNKRFLDLELVMDERICDGFYWSKALRLMETIFSDFSTLETPLDELAVDNG